MNGGGERRGGWMDGDGGGHCSILRTYLDIVSCGGRGDSSLLRRLRRLLVHCLDRGDDLP